MTILADDRGTVTIAPGVLTRIVVQAAESVDGARVRRARRRLEVVVGDGHARVELELAVRLGAIVPDVARTVQERVAEALGTMCEVTVDGVDISVEELE